MVAIRDMERAGIDIVTDGEIRRESYSNRFATALEGIDAENPAHHHRTLGPADAGAARGRQNPPHRPGRTAGHGIPAPQHRSRRQDHPARPVHHEPAGQERILQGRRRAGDGDGGGRQRRSAGVAKGRRRRDPARRALGAQRSRPPPSATPSRRSIARCRASRCRPWCISASAMPPWCPATPSRPAIRSWRSSPIPSPSRSRSRRRSRNSISACSRISPSKKILLGVIDLGNPEIETADRDRRSHPPRPEIRLRRPADPGAGLRHEIHAAPCRLRQTQGDERRGRDRAQGNQLAHISSVSRSRSPRPGHDQASRLALTQ